MPITSALLEFLLNLLRDPEAADAFRDDPAAVLDEAGLGNVTAEDVDACMPVLLDYAPVIGDREYNAGGNTTHGGDQHQGGGGHHDGHHDEDHGHAVQQMMHVVNNYSYNDTITDQSVNQNIWANGDVTQLFDNDAVIASGAGAVAAGDDAIVDNSHNEDNSVNTEIDVEIEDSFNEETEIDVEIEDSFNEDNSVDNSVNTEIETGDITVIEDSGNTTTTTETNTDIDVNIEDNVVDSYDDNVIIEDNVVDSGNTEIEVEEVVVDSFNDNVVGVGNAVDNEIEVEADVVVEAPVEAEVIQ